MTDTLRSILITHPKMPDVTFRVGVHTPDAIGPSAKPAGEQRVMIEVQSRTQSGVVETPGRLTLDQFEDLAAEIVRIGKRALPKSGE